MSEPWNWYAGGPAPNPTPPFRLPEDQVGPMPPVGPTPMPMSGQADAPVSMPPRRQGRRPKRRVTP